MAAEKGNETLRNVLGEIIGTFLMCFLGIGAVTNATLGVSGAFGGPFQVGMVWGITIAIAIYATRNLSCAHFNPAVTTAMCVTGRLPWGKWFPYIIGQLIGAIIAAACLWALFGESCAAAASSIDWASIWAERTPNGVPAASTLVGCLGEGIGVFILVFIIFSMTEDANVGRPNNNLFPLFIGLTVTMIIVTVGPITDAGLNPARDLGPRVIAAIFGMDRPMNGDVVSTLLIYTVAPLIGGVLAGLFYTKFVDKQHADAKAVAED